MSAIADGLILEPTSFKETGQPNILRPVYGSLKNMNVKIETLRVYNQAASENSDKEQYIDEEVAFFQTDKYSRVPVRTKHLSREYLRDLGGLINAHRDQKNLDELKIVDWQAIGAQEKQFILDMQIYTVNQLAHFPEIDAHRLGPDGMKCVKLAQRHVATKDAEKREKEESLEAVKVLRAELAELKAQLAAKETKKEDVLEVEAKKAKAKKTAETATE